MAKKRKTLPKDFSELLATANIETLKAVYEKCELDAYDGSNKESALFLRHIPDELVRWLVEQGADINYRDTYGKTALHAKVGRGEDIALLVELGADINTTSRWGDTPLHIAAGYYKAEPTQQLINLGADITIKNGMNHTPLESALARCSNIDIVNMVKVAQVFIDAKAPMTTVMQESVTAIGERFEFHRDNFNKDYLQETDEALNELYEMFGVTPVKKINKHDGVLPIVVHSETWQQQHHELWEYLVPGSGHADTIQGEVIRITGRVSNEIMNNGGINWDKEYKKMLKALLNYLETRTPLTADDLELAAQAVAELQSGQGDDETALLCHLAVKWVLANPEPLKIGKVEYRR
jgi:hypothetical protein